MPMRVAERDDATRLLVWAWDGEVKGGDVVTALAWQADQGLWAYSVLHDATATTYTLNAPDLNIIDAGVRRLSKIHGARGRVALVARLPALFGMSRVHEVNAPEFRVFYTRQEAEDYLTSARRP